MTTEASTSEPVEQLGTALAISRPCRAIKKFSLRMLIQGLEETYSWTVYTLFPVLANDILVIDGSNRLRVTDVSIIRTVQVDNPHHYECRAVKSKV